MKITDIFLSQEKTFSFEFFPPKDELSAVDFGINIGRLMKLSPSFVTVTYGAGGSTQERTFALVEYLQNAVGLTTIAHYTCVNATRERVKNDLHNLRQIGIKNLMLLRGDPPKDQGKFIRLPDGFQHANELIEFVRKHCDFCIGAAAYVDKHPEATSLETDIKNLKTKVDAGADFLITQLFFINEHYFQFIKLARESGINCRIIPGIIPITTYRQIERFTKMSAAKIPAELVVKLEEYKNDPEKIHAIGVEYTINQCRELLKWGAPGLHFFTLNKSRAAVEIFESL
ncbi:MAG: methylenetetrahydrofolate reductase [NAD(P)H] [Bacteroidota bacterium]